MTKESPVPLIQIDLDRDLYESAGDRLADAVHQAQIDVLDIPADDRFQVFTPHAAGELRFDPVVAGVDPGYTGVDRRSLVLVRIVMVHMYSVSTKQALFRAIVERFVEAGVRSEDVLISVVENGFEDWYAGRL
jgi:hypothetical protein